MLLLMNVSTCSAVGDCLRICVMDIIAIHSVLFSLNVYHRFISCIYQLIYCYPRMLLLGTFLLVTGSTHMHQHFVACVSFSRFVLLNLRINILVFTTVKICGYHLSVLVLISDLALVLCHIFR